MTELETPKALADQLELMVGSLRRQRNDTDERNEHCSNDNFKVWGFLALLATILAGVYMHNYKVSIISFPNQPKTTFQDESVCGNFTLFFTESNIKNMANSTRGSYNPVIETIGTFGRLGNRLTILKKLTETAEAECCGVRIPSRILDGWTPQQQYTIFDNLDRSCQASRSENQSRCDSKSAREWFYHKSKTSSACFTSLLRQYFQINDTHVLGQECSKIPSNVLHVRSGDIMRGSFNMSSETWAAGRVHPGYTPFPTSYYVAALKNMEERAEAQTVYYILCETAANPTCDYFAKTAELMSHRTEVRTRQPLLEDVQLILCAQEVAVSYGSFANVLTFSPKRQILHKFVAQPADKPKCTSDEKLYFIKDAAQRSLWTDIKGKWRNTGYQRFIVNKHFDVGVWC